MPARVVDRLSALRLRLAAPTDGLRWTGPEQWHITLHFFGDVDAALLPPLLEKLGRFQGKQPSLRLESLGLFPAKGILYAAIDLTEELRTFHADLTSRLAPGTSTDTSLPFHPHITLARSKGRTGLRTLQKLSKPALPAFGTALGWRADRIDLYESVPGLQGAAYNTVATQPLAPV